MSDFKSNAYALLIGVGDYEHPQYCNLPATVRDVDAVAEILLDPNRCGYLQNNVKIIAGKQATANNIRTALQSMTLSTNTLSTVIFYFSGHGGRTMEHDTWSTYLCPREANPHVLAETAISGNELSILLANIPAQKVVVVLDACHAAGSAELKGTDGITIWKSGLPDSYYEILSQGSGKVIIASSKKEQVSYVRPQGDLSIFTWHLREALTGKAAVRGDGYIYILDVFHYVNEAVTADMPQQVPILKVKDLDRNFPVALHLGGKSQGSGSSLLGSKVSQDIATIRETIVANPVDGAKSLSTYLASRTEWATKRNEVDLKRTDLEKIQKDLDLFGPDPQQYAAKNRGIFFLLRVCVDIEQTYV